MSPSGKRSCPAREAIYLATLAPQVSPTREHPEAGVNRTGFYAKNGAPGPYQHLAEEFSRRRTLLEQAGDIPDPRDAQIARLKSDNAKLKERIAEQEASLDILTTFKTTAVSQLAAQQDELQRLRYALSGDRESRIRDLPTSSKPVIGPC
uniref:hypothetical protein n=1 Tax=Nonomuraea sp. CA-252377 TaxID=3240003 RepID=UPI003F492808